MNRVAGWRLWLGSWILGRRPRSARAVFTPAGTPWWKRQWYRFRPPPPPPYSPATQESMQRWLRWVHPPEDEVGVGVPGVQLVLASTETSAVVLTYCVAYSNGFQLGVGIRHKTEPERPRFANPMSRPHEPPEMSLVVGVRFADGRESRWRAISFGEEPPDPTGPFISPTSGGGGGRRWDQHYWVVPLPPDGPVTITCHWPEGGVPDGLGDLDGSAIRRAGESSRRLWTD